jgi:hypothetical protein
MLRRLPLWLRWMLSLVVFGAIAIALVAAGQSSRTSSSDNAAALLRADQESRSIVLQDQAPHSAPLPGGVAPVLAAEHAVAADLRDRVRRHQLRGPLGRVRCTPTSGQAPRQPFACTGTAGGFTYPYRGMADLRSRRLTWCKFDPPPAGEVGVPLTPRCGS